MTLDLNKVVSKAVATIFNVCSSIVYSGTYTSIASSSGWAEDNGSQITYDMNVIVGGFEQSDKEKLSFYTQIQPTDTLALIQGSDVAAAGITVSNSDQFTIHYSSGDVVLKIENHDVDPTGSLYTLQLRELE